MKPTIGSRSEYNKRHTREEKPPTPTQLYVEINTHKNIVLKAEFLYLEDTKAAININTLETRIKLTRWLKSQLQTHSKEQLIKVLEQMAEKDRHRMQKLFKISI